MKKSLLFFGLCMQLNLYAMEELELNEPENQIEHITPPGTLKMGRPHQKSDILLVIGEQTGQKKWEVLFRTQCPKLTRSEWMVLGIGGTGCCCLCCGAWITIPLALAASGEIVREGMVICAACCATNGVGCVCGSCITCGIFNLKSLKDITGISALLNYMKSCNLFGCCCNNEERQRLLEHHSVQ